MATGFLSVLLAQVVVFSMEITKFLVVDGVRSSVRHAAACRSLSVEAAKLLLSVLNERIAEVSRALDGVSESVVTLKRRLFRILGT